MTMQATRPLFVCSVVAAMFAGCAHGAGTRTIASRLVHGQPEAHAVKPAAPANMSEWIARMRAAQASATPAPRPAVLTAETWNPALGEAMTRAAASPTSANYLAAGLEYYRAGILDAAEDHVNEALRLDHTSAGAYELRARIWRDWGLPNVALADAHRAVYFAPRSPEAMNTLGTVFQAMGRPDDARSAYLKALEIDVRAGYAWSNLCHVLSLNGDLSNAELSCRHAIALDPQLANARKNLERIQAAMADAASPAAR